MCSTQCVLALVALSVGLAHSWDIAVSLGDKLEFYTNGFKTVTVRFNSQNLAAIAYDEVHNTILYVDKQSDNDAICGYNLHSMESKCYTKIVGSNIHSIAFDPATETLFFIDNHARSINWVSLKPGSNNNVNHLITMDDLTPSDIAVDSCRGHIYWSYLLGVEYMERARFDGSEREVIYRDLPVFSMAMDPQTRKIYYFDGFSKRFLNSRDLDGQNEQILLIETYIYKPNELTVSNDYLYWMNGSESYKTVWQIPKNAKNTLELKEISKFYNENPIGIAANYKIKDQIKGLQDCEVLWSFKSLNIQQTTETEQPSETEQTTVHTTFPELFCVHGIKVSETSVCKCTPGYIGERCDVSVCENYCLQGDCSFNDEGLPKCRCNAGYSGERCEVYACHGFCLNDGNCSLNEKSEAVCQCKEDYVGDRCEVSDCLNYCVQGECSFNEEGLPKCRCNAGFSGERCEVYACLNYCLNNGDCSLNEEGEPFCQCVDNHEGTRCEATINDTFSKANAPFDLVRRNLTLAELLLSWRKPNSKIFVTVEV